MNVNYLDICIYICIDLCIYKSHFILIQCGVT